MLLFRSLLSDKNSLNQDLTVLFFEIFPTSNCVIMSKIIEVWSRSQFCCDTNKAWSIVSKVEAHHEKLLTQ